jgi:protein SCO1
MDEMRLPLPSRALAASLVLTVAAACGGGRETATEAPTALEGVFELRGIVIAVDSARRIVEINHEAIPGVMPAMEMPYEVAEGVVLVGLSAGDRVRGTLRVDSRGYIITSLQEL